MTHSFSELPRPLIVASLRKKNTDKVIDDLRKSEADGAKAFILHIHMLDEECRNYECFKKIATATKYPIMAINYRTPGGPNDIYRIEVMCEAIRAGFRSVDIPMYIYDDDAQSSLKLCNMPFVSANPQEVSMRPNIIQKQKTLIKKLQSMGAEVLMSAHVMAELSCEQTVSLALEIQSRGANIVKMISLCKSKEQQIEILRTNLKLEKSLEVPFLYTCTVSEYSRFIRFNAPLFGSMLIFGHHNYDELSNKEKPLLKDITAFFELSSCVVE